MGNDEKNDKKSAFLESLSERQNEARIVRKVVAIIVISIFILSGIVLSGGYLYIHHSLKPVDPKSEEVKQVEIPIGSGVNTISRILEDNGIIRSAQVFKYYVKFKNESGFMAGDYKLTPSMTIPQIIASLKTGKVIKEAVFKITVPEGKQLSEIADVIASSTSHESKEFLSLLNNPVFIESLVEQYPDLLTEEILDARIKYPLEGYLFPATYSFYEDHPSMEEIVTAMLDKTESVMDGYRAQMDGKEMSVHELLTMASLIEEEATKRVDRDQISSVFYNRLEAGMPLQTDPTVLYAKGEHHERVYYKDLEIDDPYNTYQYPGLTPGPIANAGVTSIEAALKPAETDYFYFLATPEGEVLFSKTLAEHEEKRVEHLTGS